MRNLLAILTVLSVATFSYAIESEQTDWSGGPGVAGPVIEWGNEFDTVTDINYVNEGKIVLKGNSVLTGTPEHDIDTGLNDARGIEAVDLDGDDDYDIIGAGNSGVLNWYENDGSGNFTSHDLADFAGGWIGRGIDVDSDGDIDIVACEGGSGDLDWYENDGFGNFGAGISIGDVASPHDVMGYDFDDDGDTDLIVPDAVNGSVFYYFDNDGSQNFTRTSIYDPPGNTRPLKVHMGDIDNDGDMDCVGSVFTSGGEVFWFVNDGSANFTVSQIAPRNTEGVNVNDLDMDGDLDVLAGEYAGNNVVWHENVDGVGGSWTRHEVDDNLSNADGINAADLDGDGDKDLFVSSAGTGGVFWYRNDGGGTFTGPIDIAPLFGEAHYVDIADLDGDGDEDVMSASADGNRFTWWEFQIEHETYGELTSSILDTEESCDWGSLNWKHIEPAGTNMYMQLRSSTDSANMGTWSANIESGGPIDAYVTDGDRYIQYKVIMETTDVYASPTTLLVSLSYSIFTGTDDDNPAMPTEFALNSAYPNPTNNSATIKFAVPYTSNIALSLYDVKGRKIKTLVEGEREAGEYATVIGGLSSGVYVYSLEADKFVSTKKLVVR